MNGNDEVRLSVIYHCSVEEKLQFLDLGFIVAKQDLVRVWKCFLVFFEDICVEMFRLTLYESYLFLSRIVNRHLFAFKFFKYLFDKAYFVYRFIFLAKGIYSFCILNSSQQILNLFWAYLQDVG